MQGRFRSQTSGNLLCKETVSSAGVSLASQLRHWILGFINCQGPESNLSSSHTLKSMSPAVFLSVGQVNLGLPHGALAGSHSHFRAAPVIDIMKGSDVSNGVLPSHSMATLGTMK